ncbi:MAG TPA: multicopper oxidase domain-containing protein [Vicinamibacterales bacterium]|jgi:FtsP/CotA-like multicopper oxidase with cupredoxin domain
MLRLRSTVIFTIILAVASIAARAADGPQMSAPHDATLPPVVSNDNQRTSGTLTNGVLTLNLRAARGWMRPEGEDGPALRVQAFGEDGAPLMSPAPLIRVPEGTEIAATVRNDLDMPLHVSGLCDRAKPRCGVLDVPPGESRSIRFPSGPAGTYHYAATTIGVAVPLRAWEDTQLSGAFIVDPAGASREPDRVFVITEWTAITDEQYGQLVAALDPGDLFLTWKPQFAFFINGRSWPHTERLSYPLGAHVRWRVINLTTQIHPMHLHGFYFDVDSLGDGVHDRSFDADHRRKVVTQLLKPGTTMAMTWTPERVGNWLFHCHVMSHVAPERRLTPSTDGEVNAHAHHVDQGSGMAGMILGVTVTGPTPAAEPTSSPRRLSLVMGAAQRGSATPSYGTTLIEDRDATETHRPPSQGTPIVLRRGEPVEITVVNRLPEATSVHWHGLELESFYDGVHGWSGAGARVTPMIGPGESFTVRLTPPRAGTFIYHTHLHDHHQLPMGLYGPIIVVEPGSDYDPATDHVIVIGRRGATSNLFAPLDVEAPVVMNGERSPRLVWKAGATHRVRLVNITSDDILNVGLQAPDGPVTWTPIAKDGASVPTADARPAPAQQIVGVGETYDFEFAAPPGRGHLWLDVRLPGGKWEAQGEIFIR